MDTNQILVKYLKAQDQYKRMATELHRLLDEDQRFPAKSVYTVKHRLKDPDRIIEKIMEANTKARKRVTLIDDSNFQSRIDDLLGIRVVCLRLADLVKLKQYLNSLAQQQKLRFIKGPTEKKTFLIRPGEAESGNVHTRADMQYTGYSSIHYVVKLGPRLPPPKDLARLKAELQLRTIFEEAWGEVDHKYRYELTRSGKHVPSHIETGFRDLGLYLQAAARHADHLCEDVEALDVKPTTPTRRVRRRQQQDAYAVVPWFIPNTILSSLDPCGAQAAGQIAIGSAGRVTAWAQELVNTDHQFTIKPGNPQNATGPGQFYAIRLGDSTGGNDYRTNITSCTPDSIICGQFYGVALGNMIGPTMQGVNDLVTIFGTVSPDKWVSAGHYQHPNGTVGADSHQLRRAPIWNVGDPTIGFCPGKGKLSSP